MRSLLERHSLVTEAQRLLNELGYEAGMVDGKAGSRTAAAVKAFQGDRGLSQDGSVSPELVAQLRRAKEQGLTARSEPSPKQQLHPLPSTQTPASVHTPAPFQMIKVSLFPLPSSLDKVKNAIKAGADVNERNVNGDTPLRIAVRFHNSEIVRELIKAGADVHARDEWGQTPLHNATDKRVYGGGGYRVVKELLEAGANPNARDKWGRSPLHYAARNTYNEDVIKLLLEAGADPNARCDYRMRPIDYVINNGYLEETESYLILREVSK